MRWKPQPELFEITVPMHRWGQDVPIKLKQPKKWKPKDG